MKQFSKNWGNLPALSMIDSSSYRDFITCINWNLHIDIHPYAFCDFMFSCFVYLNLVACLF